MEPQNDPRVFLAAERTYLAWIRTGIALMGFGFVLARFGIFLREFQNLKSGGPHQPSGVSVWFGVALVCIGVIVNVAATLHHVSLVANLKSGRRDLGVSRLGITIAIALACIGIATAIYLTVISLTTSSAG